RLPFPEEANRRMVDLLSDVHFAPTERARRNLLREGVDPFGVHVTGNTVIDALQQVVSRPYDVSSGPLAGIAFDRRIVLVTAHRRESFGKPLAGICRALRELADQIENIQIVYPVHLNPNVRDTVHAHLGGHPRIALIPPLDYASLIQLMRRSTIVLTDSGGIQEEAPSFGIPVLVLRPATERPEAVEAGCARIVGTDATRIVREARRLLEDEVAYQRMARVANPFGDGRAGERIAAVLHSEMRGESVARSPQLSLGPLDQGSVDGIKSWHQNTLRLPLNEDCWLGINGVNPAYSGANYRQAIASYVSLLNQNGLYVILDLHWSAPGTTLATHQQTM